MGDFEPTPLIAETGDCIHFQMSLTETGDKNIPVTQFDDPVVKPDELFASEAQMFRWSYLGQEHLKQGNGQPTCLAEDQIADNNNEQNVRNCGKLNPVGPYYDAGVVKTATAGKWHYMSTRENNFTNRSHKGQLIVVDGMGTAEVVAIVAAVTAGVALTGVGGVLAYLKLTGKEIPSLPCFGGGGADAAATAKVGGA